jgi:hypothetical protein
MRGCPAYAMRYPLNSGNFEAQGADERQDAKTPRMTPRTIINTLPLAVFLGVLAFIFICCDVDYGHPEKIGHTVCPNVRYNKTVL